MTEIKLNEVGEYTVHAEGLVIKARECARDDGVLMLQMSFGMDADTAASLLDDINGEYFRFEDDRVIPIKERVQNEQLIQQWWEQQDQDDQWIEEMTDG